MNVSPDEIYICRHCRAKVRGKNLIDHLRRSHPKQLVTLRRRGQPPMPIELRRALLSPANKLLTEDDYMHCPECKARLLKSTYKSHLIICKISQEARAQASQAKHTPDERGKGQESQSAKGKTKRSGKSMSRPWSGPSYDSHWSPW